MRDIHIIGAGPAGALLALRAADRGLRPHLYDPGGLRVWEATYGVLDAHHLPDWFLRFLTQPRQLSVHTDRHLTPPFSYRMVDNAALVHAVRQVAEIHPDAVDLSDLPRSQAPGELWVDCTGAPTRNAVWQLAVGVVLDTPAEPVFMDWRPSGPLPSFLYVQKLECGTLFEETLLAHRASISHPDERAALFEQLRTQLHRRLEQAGVDATQILREELVAIPMGTRARSVAGVRCFGARAGLINPASGYSVAHAAQAADEFLDELLGTGPGVVQKLNKELAFWLRNVGAQLIVEADGQTLKDFFDSFFCLNQHRQVCYLEGHDGIAVAKTMWQLRKHTGIRHAFLQPLWRNPWRIAMSTWRRGRRQAG